MQRSVAALTISSVALFVALGSVAIIAGDEIPVHFNGAGEIDRTKSTASFLITMGGPGLALIVVLGSARWWISKVPAQLISLPKQSAHEFWTAPERRRDFDRMLGEDMDWIGAATLLLVAWVSVVVGTATSDPVSVWYLLSRRRST